jgi:hypothetical protein
VGLLSVSTVRVYTYKSACTNEVVTDLTDDNEFSANKWIRIQHAQIQDLDLPKPSNPQEKVRALELV